jgi:ribosomal protein S1
VTRVAEFGAFVELEPGIEGLAHASTFVSSGRADGWAKSVPVGSVGAFEILSIDREAKRIGLAPVDEASSRAAAVDPSADAAPGDSSAPSVGTLGDTLRNALKGSSSSDR